MYGPALEFEEIGEEVKDEVRRQVIDKIVERVRGKLKARDEREDDPFWGSRESRTPSSSCGKAGFRRGSGARIDRRRMTLC